MKRLIGVIVSVLLLFPVAVHAFDDCSNGTLQIGDIVTLKDHKNPGCVIISQCMNVGGERFYWASCKTLGSYKNNAEGDLVGYYVHVVLPDKMLERR